MYKQIVANSPYLEKKKKNPRGRLWMLDENENQGMEVKVREWGNGGMGIQRSGNNELPTKWECDSHSPQQDC